MGEPQSTLPAMPGLLAGPILNPSMNHRRHPQIIPHPSGSGWPRIWCEDHGDLGCLFEHAKAAGFRVDCLADRLHCCVRCLGSEFLRSLGISAKQWLMQARSIECQHRLRGNESIAEIAYSVGFSHPKELSREFMKIHKISPSDYRAQIKRNGDRRQETGDRRQETGDRRQETGDRRQETGDRRQQMTLVSRKCLFIQTSVFRYSFPFTACSLPDFMAVNENGIGAFVQARKAMAARRGLLRARAGRLPA
jgi:AraC-like DNA-binding protein